MKSYLAVLVLLAGLFACQGANEITGPDSSRLARPAAAEKTIAPLHPRERPVIVPRARLGVEVASRPQPTPTPRPPCHLPGSIEQKNSPCQPCEHLVGLQRKNKPCYED